MSTPGSMVGRRIPRVQEVLIPILREELSDDVNITSWVPDIDHRVYPIVNVRRLGGYSVDPTRLDRATIELTVYHSDSLEACEDLYYDARWVIYKLYEHQTLTDVGYLHSFKETMGPFQFDSPFDDTWRVQGLIMLGVRPLRAYSLES